MTRTQLSPVAPKGPYGDYSIANSADVPLVAADVANLNYFVASGNDLVLAFNSGGTPQTVTITSASDPYGRTRDITSYSLGAGELAVFGPFGNLGWMQTNGQVWLQADSANVKLAAIRLP
jgi:hypothetical protein